MVDLAKRATLFLVLFALAVALQWLGNAYAVEPGVQVDEPGHLVTGLMVRDWVAAGLPRPAAPYALNYHVHYPRVALGYWPPVFYAVQAAWTLLLPPSRVTIMLLMAALTALLCLRAAQAISRLIPAPATAAAAGALMLMTLVPVLIYSRLVMAEILLCWLCLEAVLALAGWMEAPASKRALLFAFWAAAAILTKVTAVWLAPMVAIAIVLSGRRRLWGEKSLWGAGLLVVVLTVPWYFLAPGALHQASPDHLGVVAAPDMVSSGGILRRGRTAYDLARTLLVWMGPLLLAAVWGMRELGKRGAAMAPVAVASVLGMEVVRFSVPATAFDHRTIMPLLAPLMICAAAGFAPALARVPAVAALTLAFLGCWSVLSVTPKQGLNVEPAVRFCGSRPEYGGAIILVAADFSREGAFVSEMALSEPRPGHTLLSASNMLAQSTWNGGRYRLLTESPAEAIELIEKAPVGLIAIDSDPRRWRTPHLRLLARAIAGNRGKLRLVHSSQLLVYEVEGYRSRPRAPISTYLYGSGAAIESDAAPRP